MKKRKNWVGEDCSRHGVKLQSHEEKPQDGQILPRKAREMCLLSRQKRTLTVCDELLTSQWERKHPKEETGKRY